MTLGPIHWLIAFVVFLVIELATMGLTTVWFAGGAIAGLIANLLHAGFWTQIIVFLAVSFVLLVVTRPFAVRFINKGRAKTNLDSLIGQSAMVTAQINNSANKGQVKINGMEWTARSVNDDAIIEPGTLVKVVKIQGVKAIVKER